MCLKEFMELSHLSHLDKELMNLLNDYWPQLSISPASTKFHGNFKGGLLKHCMNLYKLMKNYNHEYNLFLTERTLLLTAFLHDICKVGAYIEDSEPDTFYYNKEHPKGHAKLSLEIIQKYNIKLTKLEEDMIRFHMGPYGTFEFGSERFGEYSLNEMITAYNDFRVKLFYFCDDIEAHTKG